MFFLANGSEVKDKYNTVSKLADTVTPAKVGAQNPMEKPDSGFRRKDDQGRLGHYEMLSKHSPESAAGIDEPAGEEGSMVFKDFHGVCAVLAVACFSLFCFPGENGSAADLPSPRSQENAEVTIIHVDKYAVYAPNLVFYWDTEMNKQKVAALTSTAERLRNRKAIIVYSATEDAQHRKRLLLLDILPFKEQQIAKEDIPSMEKSAPPPPNEPVDRPKTAEKETVAEVRPEKPLALEARPMETAARAKSFPISKEEVSAFIKYILDLNQKKDIAAIMSCFADQVNYYDRGLVSKDYIRKDMGYYFRHWDRISSSLDSDVVLIVMDQPDIRTVKFISSFSVSNSKKSINGRTENVWKIQRINNELKIIDEKQKLLSSDSR